MNHSLEHAIAIIGMSLRFPGASSPEEFWQNTLNNKVQIRRFSTQELLELGVEPDLIHHENFIPSEAPLDGLDLFDNGFFEMSPREAEITDPQHRLFLECGYEALERSGYANLPDGVRIGVFGGVGESSYYLDHLHPQAEIQKSVGNYQLKLANSRDFIATRLSYKLNLSGPSLNVQTACSTGLSAVHLASEQLLLGDCDIALAGASSIALPHQYGYVYQEGGIGSPDGTCRPFDQDARGTLRGSGVGFVVLKRFQDALDDGDRIEAVIRGSGMNNDGSRKVGFTAPSVEGQASALRDALNMADVDPESVDYIETHGTGTRMGDPIEVAALVLAYGEKRSRPCYLSSVKSQLGHLDTAAGMAGLIRAVLALKHRQIPPTAHYENPNPEIPFQQIPYRVSASSVQWSPQKGGSTFRAGVSSFGIGGTNVHLILEAVEHDAEEVKPPIDAAQLLLMSAKTGAVLPRMHSNLLAFVGQNSHLVMDTAYTLAHRRPVFPFRKAALVSPDGREKVIPGFSGTSLSKAQLRPAVFMFSGQGMSLQGYGKFLLEQEDELSRDIENIGEMFQKSLGIQILDVINGNVSSGQTRIDQPLLFTLQYAMAQWLIRSGMEPSYLLGHSIGELSAAAVAGVWSISDAVEVVSARAETMQKSPDGRMAAVGMSSDKARFLIQKEGLDVEISTINAPNLTILGGRSKAIDALLVRCGRINVFCKKLNANKAFHTSLFQQAAQEFQTQIQNISFNKPSFPIYSNVRGEIARPEEGDLITPQYWARHLRDSVLFSDMISALPNEETCFVEFGPGQTLSKLAERIRKGNQNRDRQDRFVHTWNNNLESAHELKLWIAGQLWTQGIEAPALKLISKKGRPVNLPPYPFERKRFWIPKDIRSKDRLVTRPAVQNGSEQPISYGNTSVYTRQWKRLGSNKPVEKPHKLLAVSECSLENMIASKDVLHVKIDKEDRWISQVEAQIRALSNEPIHFVYLPETKGAATDVDEEKLLQFGRHFSQFIQIAERMGEACFQSVSLVTNQAHKVTGGEKINGYHRWLDGLATSIDWNTSIKSFFRLDIEKNMIVPHLFDSCFKKVEVASFSASKLFAIRNGALWNEHLVHESLGSKRQDIEATKVWVLAGGGGRIGKSLAKNLTSKGHKCAILGRSENAHESESQISLHVDLTIKNQVEPALNKIHKKWGQIDYIVHLANQARSSSPLQFDHDAWSAINAPKIRGIHHLLSAKEAEGAEFILFSSLSSVLGGMEHAVYSASNAYLDGLAELHESKGGLTSISWDTWQFSNDPQNPAPHIAEEQAVQLLFKLMDEPRRAHWIISSVHPQKRTAFSERRNGNKQTNKPSEVRLNGSSYHLRPELAVEFVAPVNSLQEKIADVWKAHLAINDIGIDDNFFDLGGDSLLLVQLHNELEKISQRPLTKTDLFELSTIRALSTFMNGQKGESEQAKSGVQSERARKMREQLFHGDE